MEKVSKQSRILAFDVVRVLAMFWVVTYHFGCEYSLQPMSPIANFFCITPNFDFGNVAVTLFLVLSGALLYRKYGNGNVGRLSTFYIKRARTIYPPFWIVNLYIVLAMARHWMAEGSPFFAGNPLKLLLTVAGFDGYVNLFGFENYYFCGEWFVGAIVLLYLLFPLLSWAYTKNKVALLAILVVCYGMQFVWPDSLEWKISAFPATLILKFVLGFVLMNLLPKLQHRWIGWASLAVFLLLCLVKTPAGIFRNDLLGTIAGIVAFFAVINFARKWDGSTLVGKVVAKLAPLTYCVFLLQHVCINWLQIAFVKALGKPVVELSPAMCLGLLAVTFTVILVAAYVLKFVSDRALRFAEGKFLS